MDLSKIKFVVCDVDGTLTDGGMYITSEGTHFKRFNTKDGMAVKMLYQNNYHVGLISHSKITEMVEERARMLSIKHCYVGDENKLTILNQWIKELNITLDEVAYLGDDINDQEIMENVGFSICPSDSSNQILNIAHIILKSKGGDACLREFVERYLSLN